MHFVHDDKMTKRGEKKDDDVLDQNDDSDDSDDDEEEDEDTEEANEDDVSEDENEDDVSDDANAKDDFENKQQASMKASYHENEKDLLTSLSNVTINEKKALNMSIKILFLFFYPRKLLK